MLSPETTLNCRGQLLSLEKPIVMGILNVTSDSFYDGGKYTNQKSVLIQVEKMLEEGASVIDIGGMSSRPGAEIINVQEELSRIIQPIQWIMDAFPKTIISVDTVHAEVIKAAVDRGASILNDISAGTVDNELYTTVANLEIPYILMHMKGTPKTMQQDTNYEDVTLTVLDFLIQEVGILRSLGVKDIVIDPGFGFGKSIEQNYELLRKMHVLKILDLPILAGISRKSMIYKFLETTAHKALNGTTALHIIALQQGAKILRVHDVKEAIETIKLYQMTNGK